MYMNKVEDNETIVSCLFSAVITRRMKPKNGRKIWVFKEDESRSRRLLFRKGLHSPHISIVLKINANDPVHG